MQKTAFILFTRTAAEEAVLKFIDGKDNSQNKQLAKSLIGQSKKLLESSGFPYFVFSTREQNGETFGKRLGNAFQEVYQKGFENVIAIGNDCPQLTKQVLQKASQELQENKLVLGPTEDGGVYLLGLNKSVFDLETFQELPWETELLLAAIKVWSLKSKTEFTLLATYKDIDCFSDFFAFVNILPNWSVLFILLKQLLLSFLFIEKRTFILPFTGFNALQNLRAPPC